MYDKVKLFLDFDETITLSTKQFVKLANKKFKLHKDWQELKVWNFTDLYPNITVDDINEIFCSDDFFVDLEPHKGVIETIDKLKDNLDIYIATIGLKENLNKKIKWLNNNLNDISFNFIGVPDYNGYIINDKSNIDMSGSIFIDDRLDNLKSSNARLKILYKDYRNYSWQKTNCNEEIYIVNTWDEIYDILDFFIKHNEML